MKECDYEIDEENIFVNDISKQNYLRLLVKQYPTIAEA